MEDNKKEKLNNIAADLPEVPRTKAGKIDIDKISLGKSKRGNTIVSNEIFDAYYRELPDKVENASGSWRTVSTGGKIKILGGDPENDLKIQTAGGNSLQATRQQQRTFKEVISEMLVSPATLEDRERLGLHEGATQLEVIIAGQLRQAGKGNSKAAEFLRDTVGEKPTENINASIESITPEDKELLERVSARLKNQKS